MLPSKNTFFVFVCFILLIPELIKYNYLIKLVNCLGKKLLSK